MATAKTQPNVDLFGNSTLTPRQMVQQQLDALLKDTAARTASLDQRSQGVAKMGAATGGLIGEALIGAGVLPEPPERARARRLQEARDATQKAATEQGIDPVNNPKEFADLAASHFLRAGDEQAALMAIQYRQLHEANERTAAAERAKINASAASEAKDLSGFTPESRKAFVDGGRKDPSLLVSDPNAPNPGRSPYFSDVDLADGSKGILNHRTGKITDPATDKVITDPKRLGGAKYNPDLKRRLAANEKAGQEAGEEQRLLDGKIDALDAVGQALGMLDEGIYSGGWAEWQMSAAKLGPMDKTRAANTERFQAYLGDVIIPGLKEFGGNDSNEERAYLEKVRGGKVTMEEPALRKILENAERKIARGIARSRKRAKEAGLPADEAPRQGGKHGVLDADGVPAAPGLPSGWKVKVK